MTRYFYWVEGSVLRFTDNPEHIKGVTEFSFQDHYTYKSARLAAKSMMTYKGCDSVEFVGGSNGD